MFYPHTKCRACGHTELTPVLDLGLQPLANNFACANGEREGYAPLKVMYCRTCTLAQLSVVVGQNILYKDYAYVSNEGGTMQCHFVELLYDIGIEVKPKRKMLEIGSNTGAFLNAASPRFDGLGFEPAANLARIANDRGIKTIPRFFDVPHAVELAATKYRADVIVARHVFAHIDDWHEFIAALEFVSHKDTLVVIEVPWVEDMFKMNSFDQIYHEHLSYVSIRAIHRLLEKTAFYVHCVKHYSIHGGAIGIFIRRKGEDQRVNLQLEEEDDLELQWTGLAANAKSNLSNLKSMVQNLLLGRKTICGFGASAKATVWCNACGFTSKEISFICDSTPQKQGKFVPGTDIPIVPESRLMEADCSILFCWNFASECLEKNKAFTERDGKWVAPCPDVRILE